MGIIALCFAVIQAGLLLAGWGLGDLLQGVVGEAARLLSFLLLAYVGGNMLIAGIKARGGPPEVQNLSSFKNMVLGGIATSIDAAAVGAAKSIEGLGFAGFMPLFAATLIITIVTVVAGILSGKKLGENFGSWARTGGGIVLLLIAVWDLIG